ncbi:SIR2 family protein, partial [Psychrobacter celer]
LVTYGYSFGDEHINRVMRDMLTIPSTHLVIISFNDPLGRIMKLYDEWGRHSQISLLIGPELADITNLTQYYLPKAAIDKTTSRMTELLKQRLPNVKEEKPSDVELDLIGPVMRSS